MDFYFTDKIAPADITSTKEEEDDTTQIFPVIKYALDHVNELRRLISYFDNAEETLQHLNKI